MPRAITPDFVGLDAVIKRIGDDVSLMSDSQHREARRKMRAALRQAGVRETTVYGPRDFRYPSHEIDNYLKDKLSAAA
jgi:hypothetical protein